MRHSHSFVDLEKYVYVAEKKKFQIVIDGKHFKDHLIYVLKIKLNIRTKGEVLNIV